MVVDIQGIRLKLSRAWDQINGLKPDIRAFLDGNPYEPRVKFDTNTQTLTISVHINKATDPMWGVRIGEIVHNLRSALDHLIYTLVVTNTRQQPATKKNQFPVFQSEAGFCGHGTKTFLHSVGNDAIDLIKSEQPFSENDGGTGEGINSPLWHLNELSNVDKHRMLHLTGTLVEAFNFTFPPLKRDATIQRQVRSDPGPIQENAVLARAWFPGFSEWPFTEPDVHCELRVDVAFDQRTPAVGGWLLFPTLVDIANRTEHVVRRIAKDIFETEL